MSWFFCPMRRAFANLAAGTPFPRANIRCIRTAGWAILGLAVLILAELFRAGADLQDDQALTV